ncbi:MAG TPA: Rpn family recombination-promoting nuclease/putative transposase, partial [Saprospiraceae bacterium]|nr:Rpn family recombination-promoting nuclease/putative transposase [Saprospiraceae bacterium]
MTDENTSVHNPHDSFFKSLMHNRETALAFLEEFLPDEVKDVLDLQSLELANTTFLTDELKQYFSDIVFKLKMRGTEDSSFLSLLMEHKSNPGEYVEFQLLGYTANGYLTQLKEKKPLQIIIPFVYYHGRETWRLKQLSEYFPQYPASLRRFVPEFDKIFISLFDVSPEHIEQLTDAMLQAALMVQRNRYHSRELVRIWVYITETLLPQSEYSNFLTTISVYSISLIDLKPEELRAEILKHSRQKKSTAMSTYDQLIQKGEEQGIQKGKIEG